MDKLKHEYKLGLTNDGMSFLLVKSDFQVSCKVCGCDLQAPFYFCKERGDFWCEEHKSQNWNFICLFRHEHEHNKIHFTEIARA